MSDKKGKRRERNLRIPASPPVVAFQAKVFPQWMYGDPAIAVERIEEHEIAVLERKQARAHREAEAQRQIVPELQGLIAVPPTAMRALKCNSMARGLRLAYGRATDQLQRVLKQARIRELVASVKKDCA